MTGIYKIENLLNGKCYIGQATDIKKRWNAHRNVYKKEDDIAYEYPLYRAFRKYGIDNFSFTVLEECTVTNLNKKEIEYIKKHNSFFNGYNQTFGGDHSCVVEKEKIIGVINDLENTDMYHKEIATKWGLSTEMVQGINTGRYWKHDRTYPIQTKYKNNCHIKKDPVRCCDCGKEVFRESKRCINCERKRRNSNRMIGKPSKETLFNLLTLHKNFTKVAKMFNVTDNALRKWCKAYGLPYKTSDYT